MPHAVILDANEAPQFGDQPLARQGGIIHKVTEVATSPKGWLLKSLVLEKGNPTRFLTRIDRRDDGLVVHLDDHMEVERSPLVFDHLALIAKRTLEANPGSKLGKTNLEDRIHGAAPAA